MMYKQNKIRKSSLNINTSYEGETLEHKIERITTNKEPIKDGAPLIYQERKDGINPAYDIRTDRWDVAIDAMDKVSKTHTAQREQRIGEKTYDTMTPEQQSDFNNKFPGNKHAINAQNKGEA